MAEAAVVLDTSNSKRYKALDIRGYKPDHKMSLPQRTAHYLNWAADTFPNAYTPYNLLLKAILGVAKTPRVNDEGVERLRRSLHQSVKKILRSQYNREIVSQPGYGVRATSSDLDMVQSSLTRKMRTLRSAKSAVALTVGMVDPSNIPNTAEAKPWKDWFTRSAKDIVKQLGEMEKKMLPPSTETE